jgi:hypothetical protein
MAPIHPLEYTKSLFFVSRFLETSPGGFTQPFARGVFKLIEQAMQRGLK